MNKFIKEALSELHNVTWPTKQHAVKISKITIGFTLASAVIFGFFDHLLSEGFTFLARMNPRNNIPIERIDPNSSGKVLSGNSIVSSGSKIIQKVSDSGSLEIETIDLKKGNNN